MIEPKVHFDDLKEKLKSTWMAGDYGEIAPYTQPHAIEFAARRRITPGMAVLDIGCGTGNVSIPLALVGATVTGVDIATNLLSQARRRAAELNVTIEFDEGDAEDLPYEEESFDLVVSMYGAMFAPQPERVVTELLRVCKTGGQIALANWTPQGFMGRLSDITAKYSPLPPFMPPPLLWGDESTVEERFRDKQIQLEMTPVRVYFQFPFGIAETVELFRLFQGPVHRAFNKLDRGQQDAFRGELEQLWADNNQADDGTTYVQAEYLEVLVTKTD